MSLVNPSFANDPLLVFKSYLKQANNGSAGAMNKVAQYHHYGINMPKDLAKAREWYLKAAENGFVYSQHIVGDFYAQGLGGGRDLNKAVYWYEQAASLWYLRSQLTLAKLLIDEKNSPQQAKYWCERLAQAGDPWGQSQLAQLLNQSNLHKDKQIATQWLEKAAIQGHTQSQYELGLHYLKSAGLNDLPKAKYWLKKAASSGIAQANLDLQNLSQIKHESHGLLLPNLEVDMKRIKTADANTFFEFGQNWQ
ncbi:MAG: tetratricopeptide repeat protein, partial [Candidatus Sericytochromatia bacterium]